MFYVNIMFWINFNQWDQSYRSCHFDKKMDGHKYSLKLLILEQLSEAKLDSDFTESLTWLLKQDTVLKAKVKHFFSACDTAVEKHIISYQLWKESLVWPYTPLHSFLQWRRYCSYSLDSLSQPTAASVIGPRVNGHSRSLSKHLISNFPTSAIQLSV